MGNFFNDLNKMVNTIQKVDKLLTEKPKRPRTKYITKRFTEEEYQHLKWAVELYYSNICQLNRDDYPDYQEELRIVKKLSEKVNYK